MHLKSSRLCALTTLVSLLAVEFFIPHAVEAKIGFRQLTSIHPVAVQRGTSRQVRVRSNFTLDNTYATFFDRPGIAMKYAETKPIKAPRTSRSAVGTPFRFDVTVPSDQPTGVYEVRVATDQAVSSISHLLVTDYPVIEEAADKKNNTPETAQTVSIPAAICGVCEKDEDIDCFRFKGARGQKITAQVYAQRVTECIHIMVVKHPVYHMNPILTLVGPSGQIVAENDNFYGGDSFFNCELPEDGDYVVKIRDVRFAGNKKFSYCIELSDRPFLKAMFPLAIQQGKQAKCQPVGYGFEGSKPIQLTASKNIGNWNPIRYQAQSGLTNQVALLTSPLPQYAVKEGNETQATATKVNLPCGISGCITKPDGAQFYSFEAKKGQYYQFEVEAHRHGLPLDSLIEIYNEKGSKLAEADDTSTNPHAYAWTAKDSQLRFLAPADGRYYVSVRDMNGRGGDHFVYYLKAKLDGPDFDLYGEYYYAMLAPGTRMLWFAHVRRLNGFNGPVKLDVEGLPKGVTLTPATIPAGMNHCALILTAAKDAKIDAGLVRVVGKASVTGPGDSTPRELKRYGMVTCELQQGGGSAQIRWPCKTQIVGVTKPLDLVTVEASPAVINLKPGEKTEITVKITRQKGKSNPVTLAMSHMYYTTSYGNQLPPGVTLSSESRTQLKGNETEAKIILEASKTAKPVKNLPVAIMARVYVSYNISTNYASTPISLSVNPAK
ncbi:MAG: PPC domain-containing protein [Planctomycetes bacterium]|nr:PPC domain-containing protein [Planctomycetota bacterium]MCH9723643.1 PPC domain-containing protein [Planctomycetota bacterium]MCH9778461.1 PPC domain-containing protein [Planctomycetota bacterium]MCH9791452.1 PPC domain-containing protein [Planctomycetota bacterium]